MLKPTKQSDIQRSWHLVNAENQILGRLSTRLVALLVGKTKPYFSRNLDCGDHVVVTNVDKIVVSGRKEMQKMYKQYSGYPGGQKTQPLADVRAKHPARIIEHAVAGMLPDNKLKSGWLSRLHLFIGNQHDYTDKFKLKNQANMSDKSYLSDSVLPKNPKHPKIPKRIKTAKPK